MELTFNVSNEHICSHENIIINKHCLESISKHHPRSLTMNDARGKETKEHKEKSEKRIVGDINQNFYSFTFD